MIPAWRGTFGRFVLPVNPTARSKPHRIDAMSRRN
jgi:hypothetical protein